MPLQLLYFLIVSVTAFNEYGGGYSCKALLEDITYEISLLEPVHLKFTKNIFLSEFLVVSNESCRSVKSMKKDLQQDLCTIASARNKFITKEVERMGKIIDYKMAELCNDFQENKSEIFVLEISNKIIFLNL